MVQLVLGVIRSRRTAEYRIVKRYAVMKAQKGYGKSIIAMARKLSKIIWYMLKNDTPFDTFRMTDPYLLRTAVEIIAAAEAQRTFGLRAAQCRGLILLPPKGASQSLKALVDKSFNGR
jgi:hypothetical protein